MNAPQSANRLAHPWMLTAAVLVGLKLWLISAQPIVAVGGAGHDDRLFLELARHILQGDWLGSYSQFTLMKGPMYSLWIAATFTLGVPLPLGQHLLYLLGCILLVKALRPALSADWQTFALFVVLWWQPMSYESPVLGRVLRQNIYTPAALLVFAGLFALVTRRRAATGVRVAWGMLLGTSAAMLWLTREESVWIGPSAALLIGVAVWESWRAGDRLRPLLAPLLAGGVFAAGIVGTVSTLNYRHYGWFGTVEFRAPEFIAAYGSLQRPIASYDVPYVPVTREARLKLYRVSPTFAELQPQFEGGLGAGWAGACVGLTGHPSEDREIAGGWFMWALRDAVVATGHAHSAREALDFYAQIAAEVNRACDAGLVGPVHPRHDSLVPPWRPEHTQRLRDGLVDYVEYFFLFRGFDAYAPPSHGSADVLMLFRDLARWPLAPSDEAPALDRPLQRQFDGWRLATLQRIGKVFRWTCATLAISGLAAWVWLALRVVRRRGDPVLFWFATATLGGALAVMVINLLVHVLSFFNRSVGAFAQAYPLLVVFGAIAWIGVAATAQSNPAPRSSDGDHP